MKQFKFLIVLLLAVLIIPSVALAAWWNPFSWGIWNSVFHFQQQVQKSTQQQINKPADQTADWKTYTNTQYGFEFKYPSNYQVENPANFTGNANQTEIAKLSGSPDNISIIYAEGSILDLSNGKIGTYKIWFDNSSNQWMDIKSVEAREGGTNTITEKINPSYNSNNLIIFGDSTGVSSGGAVALSNNKFIIISAGDSGPIANIIKNIISTFKFITPSTACTPNWQCGWGRCVNGYQSQVAVDSNNCGLPSSSANIACPALAKLCTSSSQPSITVTSPNGGEQWQIGTKQTVSYNISSNMPHAGVCMDAYAVDYNGNKTDLGGIMSVSTPITVDLGTNTTVHSVNLTPGNYKIELDASWCAETNSGLIASDTSDNYFTIVAPAMAINGACGSANGQTFATAPTTNLCSAGTASAVSIPEYVGGWYWTCAGLNGGISTHCTAFIGSAQPSITVTSPNGGETWQIGTSRQITFQSSYPVNVYLSSQNNLNGFYYSIAPNTSSPYNWIVGNATAASFSGPVAAGNYYICISNGDTGQSDCSDNYFTIVAP